MISKDTNDDAGYSMQDAGLGSGDCPMFTGGSARGAGAGAHEGEVQSPKSNAQSHAAGEEKFEDLRLKTKIGQDGMKGTEPEANIEHPTSNTEHRMEDGESRTRTIAEDEDAGVVVFRPYQQEIFNDHRSGIVVLHWARQIGKSFVLAAWAVYRLLDRPGRLVTVLSNSRENGSEFLNKCAEICALNGTVHEKMVKSPATLDYEDMRMELRIRVEGKVGRIKVLAANPRTARGFSGDLILDEFAFHEDADAVWAAAEPILASNKDFLCRIASTGNGKMNLFYRIVDGGNSSAECGVRSAESFRRVEGEESRTGTISAVPYTYKEIQWDRDENEPLPWADIYAPSKTDEESQISKGQGPESENIEHRTSNTEHRDGETPLPDPLPTPASCGEGEEKMDAGAGCVCGPYFTSRAGFKVSRVTRTMANEMGVEIYDSQTREPITPEQARAQALDKAAYDQNYECSFADETLSLLTHELISAAECDEVGQICEQDWTPEILKRLRLANGSLYAGLDVGRKVDLSVLTVLERVDKLFYVRGMLRMRDMRLPDQELRLKELCRCPQLAQVCIDMTGLGLGLFEYAQRTMGSHRISGINFASSVSATRIIREEGRKRESVRVTEAMAMEVLRVYEDRRIKQPRDWQLREDLRKPGKVTSPGGRVSIAATRDGAGHADHFWSLALALEAAGGSAERVPFAYETVRRRTEYAGVMVGHCQGLSGKGVLM